MRFNEFHNAEYWQKLRNAKAGQITLQQIVMMAVAGALFFFFTYLFAIAEEL